MGRVNPSRTRLWTYCRHTSSVPSTRSLINGALVLLATSSWLVLTATKSRPAALPSTLAMLMWSSASLGPEMTLRDPCHEVVAAESRCVAA